MGKYKSFGHRTGGFLKLVGGFLCIVFILRLIGEFLNENLDTVPLLMMIIITGGISSVGHLIQEEFPT
jgi:hypothetical protein